MKFLTTIITVLIVHRVTVCSGCTEPQPVLHAYRYTDNIILPEGSWVNYTCYQNYYWISGDLKRECKDGDFTGQPPVCGEEKVLTAGKSAEPDPASAGGNNNYLTDGDILTCESTTSTDTSPSWTIEFDNIMNVFSGELEWKLGTNAGISRIDVYVRNASGITFTLCDKVDLPVTPLSFKFNCQSTSIGSRLIIRGFGNGLTGFTLCEVQAMGKDWIYECGDPPFIYGAEVSSSRKDQGSDIVQYSCLDGFYYGGKNTESTCQNGLWTKVEILCLPFDSLYNFKAKSSIAQHSNISDGDQDTCALLDSGIIDRDPDYLYRRLLVLPDFYKPVETLSVTLTIAVNETWDNIKIFCTALGFREYHTPPCQYDGLSTDPYRVRTFHCQPFSFINIVAITTRDLSTDYKNLCEVRSTGRFGNDALECIRGEYENEYKGKMNYTWDGKTCDYWSDAPPDKAINTNVHKYFFTDEELNYCRNIGGEKKRPWCYVDNFQSVGYCPLAFCNEICKLKEENTEYRGQQAFTTSGKKCRAWSEGNNEGRKFLKDVFSDGIQTESYCRNPGYSQFEAWCYVDGPASTIIPESCHIPECPNGFLHLTVRNNETSNLPLYLHQCYQPLDSFTVQHYFNLTIDQTNINDICRSFQDKQLFCYVDGIWNKVDFECYNLPPETTMLLETSSLSLETTFQIEETSTLAVEETSFQFDISSSVVESFTVEATSSMVTSSSVEASSSIDASSSVESTSSIETSSSIDTGSSIELSPSVDAASFSTKPSLSIEDFVQESYESSLFTDLLSTSSTVQTVQVLDPSFVVSSVDTSTITTALPGTSDDYTPSNTPSNTPPTLSESITATKSIDTASSSFWHESTNNDTGKNMTCGCFCMRDDLVNLSDPVIRARVKYLTKDLEMDYEMLSANIRKRISAEDDRPSVTYVGSSAMIMMIVFLVMIIFPDIMNLCRFLHNGSKSKTRGS